MKNKLIKAKIIIETEIVIENFYNEDPQKCAEDGWRGNRADIVSQACEMGEYRVVDVKVIKKLEDIPKAWSPRSLPWLPNVTFGDKEQYKENTIESFLVKK